MVPIMNIRPIDVLHMLDEEDLADMEHTDLARLCTMITLDNQLNKESYGDEEDIGNRRAMC